MLETKLHFPVYSILVYYDPVFPHIDKNCNLAELKNINFPFLLWVLRPVLNCNSQKYYIHLTGHVILQFQNLTLLAVDYVVCIAP